jgi:N utilization substance protein B
MSGKRTKARQHALQGLYQWQVAGQDIRDIINQFLTDQDVDTFEVPYFKELMSGVPANVTALDAELSPCLDRSIASVDPVECATLRLAAYELAHHPEIPYRVVINEAVELAKIFGAEEGHKYVNGVLDKLAKKLRAVEMK